MIFLRNKHQHQKKFAPKVWPRKGANTNELQAHHCMTPEQWTWLLYSVSVIPENTVTLQKFNQLIGIELLTSCFLDNLGASFQSQGGKCPFPPCGRPRSEMMTTFLWKISAKCTNFEVLSLGLGLELQVSSLGLGVFDEVSVSVSSRNFNQVSVSKVTILTTSLVKTVEQWLFDVVKTLMLSL